VCSSIIGLASILFLLSSSIIISSSSIINNIDCLVILLSFDRIFENIIGISEIFEINIWIWLNIGMMLFS